VTPAELRAWRDRHFLDQDELASLLEVHPQTVRNWEHGRTRIPHLAVLALETLAGERERLRSKMAAKRAELNRKRRANAERQKALRDKRIAAAL